MIRVFLLAALAYSLAAILLVYFHLEKISEFFRGAQWLGLVLIGYGLFGIWRRSRMSLEERGGTRWERGANALEEIYVPIFIGAGGLSFLPFAIRLGLAGVGVLLAVVMLVFSLIDLPWFLRDLWRLLTSDEKASGDK